MNRHLFYPIVFVLLFLCTPYTLCGQLPEPSGPHCIGKTRFLIASNTRPERYTEEPSDFRKLTVNVWYPGDCTGVPAPYMPTEVLGAFKKSRKIADSIDISFISRTKTHAKRGAGVAPALGKGPVLIFSHGSSTPMELYTGMFEKLASNGYFVFAVSHTYNSAAVQFPDGSIILANRAYFDNRWNDTINDGWEKMMALVKTDAPVEKKRHAIGELFSTDFPPTGDMDYWTTDIAQVIERVTEMNRDRKDLFYKRLNLKKVGGFGHSYGGSAMGHALMSLPSLKAAVNLDGWQFGKLVVGQKFPKPFLYVRGGYEQVDPLNSAVYSLAGPEFRQVKVSGTLHSSFLDLPWFSGPQDIYDTGTLAPDRNAAIINDLLLAFFDAQLKGQKEDWDNIRSKYRELEFE